MVYGLLIALHVLVSLGLIVSVLLQSSKGGGLAGTFGGSGVAGGIFGGRGAAPFLTKATTVCAVLFFITSLSLTYIRPGAKTTSVLERAAQPTATGSLPAVPEQAPITAAPTGTESTAPAPADPTPASK